MIMLADSKDFFSLNKKKLTENIRSLVFLDPVSLSGKSRCLSTFFFHSSIFGSIHGFHRPQFR
jgi:hypothetical protein